jgi:deoxyribodipyrimidine photo-lyase
MDNTALNLLYKLNLPIIPVFIFNPEQIDADKNKYYSKRAADFLKKCIEDLRIKTYRGSDIDILEKLKKEYDIKNIGFNLDYTPFARKRDETIIKWCEKNKINIITAEDYTMLKLRDIKPYKIFTPFYKKYGKTRIPEPATPRTDESIRLIKINIDITARKEALAILRRKFTDYAKMRDFMVADYTTHLSVYIKFGIVSIREVRHNLEGGAELIKELFWRDFYAMTAFYFPNVLSGMISTRGNNQTYRAEPKWSYAAIKFEKWCRGETGFPIVDAGMRQLNETGWMHNRARMIVATFLTKDLHIDWREGERYFAQKLIDYDPASNSGGWQWCASVGNDCQPYFRVFSPWLQAERFDPDAEYIKKWVPELRAIPTKDILKWKIKYKDWPNKYIAPMVNHEDEAKAAISAFKND